MNEFLEQAVGELKRADHMIFVSLKYTRTVDVIKNILERLVSCFEFTFDYLADRLKEENKITEVPKSRSRRIDIIKDFFKDNTDVQDYLDFYYLLRKLNRAEFTRRQEFRRHVTMGVLLEDGRLVELNIDVINDYYEKTKSFVDFAASFMKAE